MKFISILSSSSFLFGSPIRSFRILIGAQSLLLFLGAAAVVASVPDPAHGEPDHSGISGGPDLADHIPAMIIAAERNWFGGDQDGAELIFAELLSLPVALEEKREVLLKMADLFENTDAAKAIIILEKFAQAFPRDVASTGVLLRLGTLYRAQGAYETAAARYFRVLNTTLNVSPDELEAARRSATMARFELAEMLIEQERLSDAAEIYRKIELLDLSDDERMKVRFRLACIAFETRDYTEAVAAFSKLREDDPAGVYRLETIHFLAASLKTLGRRREAFEIVTDLLRSQLSSDPADAAQTAYWKRRTGNELANEFYKQEEYLSALSIYQALVRISDDPQWRWSAVYQIGLCFEHLELPERALEAYRAMIEGIVVGDDALVEADVSLRDLAQWRLEHVKWMLDYGERFRMMTGSIDADS